MAAKQPPPLMKKHSQTDLVSRLKTRKILGVGGEDDDGEVHRSKGLAVCLSCSLLWSRHHGPCLS
uniref:Tumor protein p53-inducible protein 11 n=1 Tax=Monodelphis domestica TaxID=13616 RepID=A0A5F8GLR7_MONDO